MAAAGEPVLAEAYAVTSYFIGDTHFGHKNIIAYEKRPFRDAEEMENKIIKLWNSTVKKAELVYHVGDLSFYPKDITEHIIQQLNGRIFLIKGNHDGHSNQWYRDIGIWEVSFHPVIIHDFIVVSHEPAYLPKDGPYRNIHGHTHSVSYMSPMYCNVSADAIGYKPMSMDDIIKRFKLDQTELEIISVHFDHDPEEARLAEDKD